MARPMSPSDFRGTSFVQLLRWRAEREPEHVLFSVLEDGERLLGQLTTAELDRQARAVGAYLRRLAEPGARALLLHPDGLEFAVAFFGCLYAGMVPVPAYPPDPERLERTLPRLIALARDAEPRLVLSTAGLAALAARLDLLPAELRAIEWVATDTVPALWATAWEPPAVDADTIALLQYTSGSSAAPKGVMVTHGNLLAGSRMIYRAFEHDATLVGVSWLPVFHDMGLIGHVLHPVYVGIQNVFLSPLDFLRRPHRWLQAITAYGATTSGAPNFAYDLCVKKITPEQRRTLDLSTWSVAYCGAEPVSADTLDRFARTFADCGFRREAFYPCYGMAEATLLITGGAKASAPVAVELGTAELLRHRAVRTTAGHTRRLVGCGRPVLDGRLAVVDPDSGVRCRPGQVGEIWVAGPHVARGYWKRPEETARAFQAFLAGGEGPFLRTGDLGVVLDGELLVTGRLKDLMIVRGSNHYPQDIERTVAACHPGLRPGSGASFTIGDDGEDRVVVVQETDRSLGDRELGTVLRAIRRAVTAAHEIRLAAAVLVAAGTIPKTSSGKIQRAVCRDAFVHGGLAERRRWVRGAKTRRQETAVAAP